MINNNIFFRLIIITIIAYFIIGCNNGTKPSPEPIVGNQPLKGQKIELSETLSPIDLEIIDSLIIFLTYGEPYFFHVYNKNTLKLIGKFGNEGRGPFEFHLPLMMSQKVKIRDSSYLVIFDDTRKRIDFVNILGAINTTNNYYKSINFWNKNLEQGDIIQSAVITSDSFIVGNSSIATGNAEYGGRFFCYDIYKDIITWEPFYPIPKIAPAKNSKGDLYKSYLALRPNGSDIAAASLFFKRIDILDKQGKLKRSIIFDQIKEPDFSKADSWPPKGSHQYFTSISVSQDYIYALDIDIDVDNPVSSDTVTIVKTTWEDKGVLPEIIKMTPRVGKMRVDEESKKIYGIRSFDSFLYIYEFGND